jgi:hypothetical protein
MRAFPAAHRRFLAAGVPLTCFVDHPIATDPKAIAILGEVLEDGRSALGAQLHAWVNPPFDEPAEPWASYAGNLPRELEAAKLDLLGEAIAAAWGAPLRAYRAGRYGIGPNTLGLLAERGYRVDSSVRARYDNAPDGPDFARFGSHAFRRQGVVEVPLTTVFTGRCRNPALYRALSRVPHARGAAARTGLLQRVALTPEGMPLSAALAAIDAALAEGIELLVFSFHSPSLEPGHTPYVRNATDRAMFDRWWDGVLNRLALRGVRATGLDDVIAAAG